MLVAEVLRAGAYFSRFSRHACQVYTTNKMDSASLLPVNVFCYSNSQSCLIITCGLYFLEQIVLNT
jgi:hypothetical protein